MTCRACEGVGPNLSIALEADFPGAPHHHDAAAVALRLWGEHRQTAGLPAWEIVGLEVISRETYHQRVAEGYGPLPATPVGVHPF